MWDILSKEMRGLVMVVDATAEETFDEARALLADFLFPDSVPYVIAANKQDREGALRPEKLRYALDLGGEALILPCTASQRTSVQFILKQLAHCFGFADRRIPGASAS